MIDLINRTQKIINIYQKYRDEKNVQNLISDYLENGRIPWSLGYNEYKNKLIEKIIYDEDVLLKFKNKELPDGYGFGLDERIVEYPWIINNLSDKKTNLLDAGSTLNFKILMLYPKIAKKKITIFTYHPEANCSYDLGVSYVFGDLRDIPFKDNLLNEIVCQSTIEHIDMDNSIYGYTNIRTNKHRNKKNYEYLKAIIEIIRILKPGGILLLTFPFGKFENHGFFQQIDNEMLNRILDKLDKTGVFHTTFFLYKHDGWIYAKKEVCEGAYSYNPHTGEGKGCDGAAHSRSICCIKFIKK